MIAYAATKRGLTDRETNMEDTHAWVMNADGSNRREIGAVIDNRQGPPEWSPDGASLYFAVAERGSLHLYRLPINGGTPQAVTSDPGFSFSFSVRKDGAIASPHMGPSDTPQLFLKSGSAAPRKLGDLNAQVLTGKKLAEVEPFTFISNDNKFEVQAFLTKPLNFSAGNKYPLILEHSWRAARCCRDQRSISRNKVYAAHGYAVLMVNYRGSTSYGQKFADAVFRDQDGDERHGRALRRQCRAAPLSLARSPTEWELKASVTADSSPIG